MEQVGVGGFGLVFVAEQQDPVRRKVALKVLKPGMDTREVIARFEAERQALALMDHPNIAKVHDAGTTDTGRPYFVMELVKGVPITDYCDQAQLTPRQRLELFIPVCQAVQHAHQKGIIHRDLKPSNVLVTLHDGTPVPKVIDFGVAKAIGQHLTEKTIYTRLTQMIGTPLYMSPEQAEMSGLDIDTRSDIYSLGVLLYELLTGTTPFDRQRFGKAAFDEIRRIIREEEPPRPSTRLTSLGETLSSVSAKRNMEPKKLSALAKGDLDWIVMKALEKDRSRRYETASGFAADVRRFLAEEPVEARPPSAWYSFRKLALRNKAALTTVALVAGALVLGTAVATWQAVRATRAEEQARAGEQRAMAVQYFLDQVMAAPRPKGLEGGLGKDVSLRETADAIEPKIAAHFKDQPTVEASLRNTLGLTYWHLGRPDLAVRQHERALELREAVLGPDHPDTVISRNNLALAYKDSGQPALAIPLFERALEAFRRLRGPDHPDTLACQNNLALAYQGAGQLDRAISLFERTLEACRRGLGPDHTLTLTCRNNLGLAKMAVGDPSSAIPLFDEVRKGLTTALGPDHLDTILCEESLAAAYMAVRKPTLAVPLFEEALKKLTELLGGDDARTLACQNSLATAYVAVGKPDQAIPLFDEALKGLAKASGPDHPDTFACRGDLGVAYVAVGEPAKAEPLLREYLQWARKQLGEADPRTAGATAQLGTALVQQRKWAEAEPFLRASLEWARKQLGEADPRTAGAMAQLGMDLIQQRKWVEAEPLLRGCLAIREPIQPDDWTTFNTRSMLGGSLLGQNRYAEAEPLVLSSYEGLKARETKIPTQHKLRLTEAIERVIALYDARGEKDKADEWRKKRSLLGP